MNGRLKPHLRISARHAAVIRQAAAAAYPNECCGLLIGEAADADAVQVTDVVPARNVAPNPSRAFAIDPQEQFDLLRATRGKARRIIGHYHSHPEGQAVPSAVDLAMAHDPEAIWVVVAAAPHTVSAPRAFHRPISGEGFREITIIASPQENP